MFLIKTWVNFHFAVLNNPLEEIVGHLSGVYEVKLLDEADPRNLFRSHAFHEKSKYVEIENLFVDRLLVYANRLPLAFVVLGESLKDRRADEWKSTLAKLDGNSNKTINSVLKISSDGLEDHEKAIFLDVVRFFKGWDKDYVFQMHDLLEVM
ncbi:hypothetical protein MLD38_035256 [Melastoma candidum]|uniref:Uncharacterized protein n=1 Tax=Melastoma candidum TaxID=119954 RepID=A0ACB9MD35_9MYRT|nr:hypothetical protein MLD38_035256 [Melastoma candidum]